MKGARHLCLKDLGDGSVEQGNREWKRTRGYHGISEGKKVRLIQLEKEDSNKQFIWFKIS